MPLKPEYLSELQRAIDRRREVLQAELREDAGRAREDVFSAVAGPGTDSGDAAQADLIADVDHAELSRDLLELRELDAAHERLRIGSYGACEECGGDIALERLRAQPAARRCFDCQRAYERLHAASPNPKL
jgi:DnaK suppressor protein